MYVCKTTASTTIVIALHILHLRIDATWCTS